MDPVPKDMSAAYGGGRARAAAIEVSLRSKPSSFGDVADRFTQITLTISFLLIVLYDSHILSLYNMDSLEIGINRVLYVIAFTGIFIGIFRTQISAVVLSSILMAYFIFLIYHFMSVSKGEFGSSEFGFAPFYARLQLFCAPMIASLIARGMGYKIKSIIYLVSSIYLTMYVLSSVFYSSSVDETFRAAAYVADYDGRGGRVVLNNALTSLAFFISFWDIKQKPRSNIMSWFIFTMCCLSVYLSFSRYYQLCLIATCIVYLISRSLRITGAILIFLFLFTSVYVILQVTSYGNPFTFIADDRSLAARAESFEAVRPILHEHFLWGVGLANTPLADTLLVKLSTFFWTDLGFAGVLYVGGIIGLIIFQCMSLTCLLSPRLLQRAQLSPELYGGICLAGMCTAIYGIIAPTLWYNGLEVFIFVLGAMCARRQSSTPENAFEMPGAPAPTGGED
jgi:hypothetical protein